MAEGAGEDRDFLALNSSLGPHSQELSAKFLQELVVELFCRLICHRLVEVWPSSLHLVVEGELGNQQDLVVILHNICLPTLALLVPPKSSLEKLGYQAVHVENVVLMGNSAEHHHPLVDLGNNLLV